MRTRSAVAELGTIQDMRRRLNTYTAYSVGCGVVWLAILANTRRKDNFNKVVLGFLGWVSGWTSATIARYLYPPPKPRRARR
jgi:hypothetical protein